MSTGQGYEKAKAELEQARKKPWFVQAKVQRDDSFGDLPLPAEISKPDYTGARWFKQEAIYDPVPALRALRVPALFLFGDHDRLIPVEKSVEIIRGVLAENSQHDFTIRVFPNVDHVMRLAAGEASGEIEPEYLKTMRDWLAKHVHPDR
jgi:pimeloyl-ACP methyl ester carboxylesterase